MRISKLLSYYFVYRPTSYKYNEASSHSNKSIANDNATNNDYSCVVIGNWLIAVTGQESGSELYLIFKFW